MDLKNFNFPKFEAPSFDMSGIEELNTLMEHDAEEQRAYHEKKDNALFDTAKALNEMRAMMDQERADRVKADRLAAEESKRNFKWVIIATTIGALTLLATLAGILVSLHLLW